MNIHEELKRVYAHLSKGTTQPYILRQCETDQCVCYLLLGGWKGTLRMAWRFSFCKLAELFIIGPLKNFFYRCAGVKIGKNVIVAPGVVIDYLYCNLIEIDDGSVLGMGSMILAHEFTHEESRLGRVRIGKDVTIGARAVVRPGIQIGDHAIVGSMSLVTHDVPSGMTVCGIPAKIKEK